METARDGWMDGASGACNWKSSVLSQIFRQHVFNMFSTCCGTWDVGRGTAPRNTCDRPGFIGPDLCVGCWFSRSTKGRFVGREGQSNEAFWVPVGPHTGSLDTKPGDFVSQKGQCLSYPAGTGINESARRFAIRGGEHGEVFGLLS